MADKKNSRGASKPESAESRKLSDVIYYALADNNQGSLGFLEGRLLTFIESFTPEGVQLKARKDMVKSIVNQHRLDIHDDRAVVVNALAQHLSPKTSKFENRWVINDGSHPTRSVSFGGAKLE